MPPPDDATRTRQLLALIEAMHKSAAVGESPEASGWTERSRQAALAASKLLREAAERLRVGTVAGTSASLIRRMRALTSRIEQFLRDMTRLETRLAEIRVGEHGRDGSTVRSIEGFEQVLHKTRADLYRSLQALENRAPYEDLANTLHQLVQVGELRGHAKASSHRDMLAQLEPRLESGDFDQPRCPDEMERDLKVLEALRAQLTRAVRSQRPALPEA